MGVFKRIRRLKNGKASVYWYVRYRYRGKLYVKSVPDDSVREAVEMLSKFFETRSNFRSNEKLRELRILHTSLKLLVPPEGFEPPTCGFEELKNQFTG